MVTLVDATVPTEQFALSDTFDAVPDAEFQSVRVVANEDRSPMPFLWASAPDLDRLHDAINRDSTARDVQRLARRDDRDLYHIEWETPIRLVIAAIVEEQGTLLGTRGSSSCWEFQVLFTDHDAVSATYDCCREYGVDLSIRRVNGMDGVTDSIDNGRVDLSDKQYEALTAAFETGYYGIPRQMTLGELADSLGVSHQALSERIRRGHQTLISRTLCDTPDAVESDP